MAGVGRWRRRAVAVAAALRLGGGQIQRGREHLLGLDLVQLVRPGRRAGGFVAADVLQHRRLREHRLQAVLHEHPRPAVARLILHPDDLLGRAILREDRLDFLLRERIELLDAHDRHVRRLVLVAAGVEVEEDLAAAQQQPAHALARRVGRVVEHQLEGAVGQIFQRSSVADASRRREAATWA